MIIRLLIIFLVIVNLAYSQVNDTLSVSALKLTAQDVTYDPGYFSIDYPNGDIPGDKGVCTDVIIRAYRLIGIDLQKDVHEDMKANFDKYPKNWGLKRPDKNSITVILGICSCILNSSKVVVENDVEFE